MEEVNKNTELDNTDKKLHISDVMISFDEMVDFIDFLTNTKKYFYDKGMKSWFVRKTLLKITINDIWIKYKN
jgi:hypothetical protein